MKKYTFIAIALILLVSNFNPVFADKPAEKGEHGKSEDAAGQTVLEEAITDQPEQAQNDKAKDNGFNEAGFKSTARIFNGTYLEWCMDSYHDLEYCDRVYGPWAEDKVIMKWNAEWDRGNAEGWTDDSYQARMTLIVNGNIPGGTGDNYSNKIVWNGPCGVEGAPLENGGYCMWGQFAVIMAKSAQKGGLIWLAHTTPTGFGANLKIPQ